MIMKDSQWKWFFYLNPAFWIVVGMMFVGYTIHRNWNDFMNYMKEANRIEERGA